MGDSACKLRISRRVARSSLHSLLRLELSAALGLR